MLLRVKKLEQTDTVPAGELGRCLGLDRIPEVKTLRQRIALFCRQTNIEEWLSELSNEWMESDKDLEGVLYVDGHVNLYYGKQVKMPGRFVSRMRLCMSGSTDWWVNDQMGAPFFVVRKTINEGMIKVLKEDIIPRLNADVPGQPTKEELETNDSLHRYMLVFDREGYSIDFFEYLQQQRIAFCSYRKNVKEDWPDDAFTDYEVVTGSGEMEIMQLAEKETVLYGKKETGEMQKQITVREIRKRSASGHQTSIITTNQLLTMVKIALLMFSRWCQENRFKYMVESFGLDSQISLQNREMSKKEIERFAKRKSDMQQEIEDLEKQRTMIIEKKKKVDKTILFKDLNENQKFDTSVNERKLFLDIIKIIAYRAETSLCNTIKEKMASPQQARTLIRKFYTADADIEPDENNAILNIKIHRTNHWADDNILEFLCNHLNETETVFPATNLTCQFNLVTS
jgi:hypothetical protein